jgi:hypothetical protein
VIACFENTCPACGHVHSCGCEGQKTATATPGLCPECRKPKLFITEEVTDPPTEEQYKLVHAPRIRFPGEELYLE